MPPPDPTKIPPPDMPVPNSRSRRPRRYHLPPAERCYPRENIDLEDPDDDGEFCWYDFPGVVDDCPKRRLRGEIRPRSSE